jgi:radical SAM superfamily enzyme YgiQ (UPF0313 family)
MSIILSTLNARYAHASLGLRCLYANLGALQSQAQIMEFVINDTTADMAERLLQQQPTVIGFGVYIWNAVQTAELMGLLRTVAPDVVLVVGGPEVSHAPIRIDVSAADYIIQGEGEIAFARLCQQLSDGQRPATRIITGEKGDLSTLPSPYPFYNDEDIRHRCIYVEASRGCPFRCEFCLSSADREVRHGFLDQFIADLDMLWQRGVRQFKFIDRTFNLNMTIANRLLDFFLARDEAYFVHFEVIPDHFPQALRQRIAAFPAAALQLEVGVQTLNPEVAKTIQRVLHFDKLRDNLLFLSQQTQAHMHVDLIVGLPGESLASFGAGLNQLCTMTDSEIQIGILKKLSGTALHRHDERHAMRYAATAPYELLQNDQLSFAEMQRMKRFARFWDLYYNNGNFRASIALLWADGLVFEHFYAFSNWVYSQTRSTWKISLERLAQLLFTYLTDEHGQSQDAVAAILVSDLMRLPGRKLPGFLRPYSEQRSSFANSKGTEATSSLHNSRQIRHSAPSESMKE